LTEVAESTVSVEVVVVGEEQGANRVDDGYGDERM
jgi:hypothetical protein